MYQTLASLHEHHDLFMGQEGKQLTEYHIHDMQNPVCTILPVVQPVECLFTRCNRLRPVAACKHSLRRSSVSQDHPQSVCSSWDKLQQLNALYGKEWKSNRKLYVTSETASFFGF